MELKTLLVIVTQKSLSTFIIFLPKNILEQGHVVKVIWINCKLFVQLDGFSSRYVEPLSSNMSKSNIQEQAESNK